ncbi:hypothetical protein [Aeromonas enteropelogenes]|uniref:hypothetical protein n=1 Tax=Aeromonas enteropelogenes TaxID=29489 RepID=UPI003F745B11
MKRIEQWSRFDAVDGLATEADMVAYLAALTAVFDDVERARAKLRDDGQPNYVLAELLAQCDLNATAASEINWGSDVGLERFE